MNKHVYWMGIAEAISSNSTCTSSIAVGAVLVSQDDSKPIALAVNGTVDDFPTCDEFGCNLENGKPRHIHAEEQIIISCARDKTKSTERGVLYITHSPCSRCALRLAQAGVIKVVYKHQTEDFLLTERLFLHFGIDFERITDEQN